MGAIYTLALESGEFRVDLLNLIYRKLSHFNIEIKLPFFDENPLGYHAFTLTSTWHAVGMNFVEKKILSIFTSCIVE
jgi:hypothetical protein